MGQLTLRSVLDNYIFKELYLKKVTCGGRHKGDRVTEPWDNIALMQKSECLTNSSDPHFTFREKGTLIKSSLLLQTYIFPQPIKASGGTVK